jgi:hypothetical protein
MARVQRRNWAFGIDTRTCLDDPKPPVTKADRESPARPLADARCRWKSQTNSSRPSRTAVWCRSGKGCLRTNPHSATRKLGRAIQNLHIANIPDSVQYAVRRTKNMKRFWPLLLIVGGVLLVVAGFLYQLFYGGAWGYQDPTPELEGKRCVSFPHRRGAFLVWSCRLPCWMGRWHSAILATISHYRRLPAGVGGLQLRRGVFWQTGIGGFCPHRPQGDNSGLAWHSCLPFRSSFWCHSSRYPEANRKPRQVARSVGAFSMTRLTD